MSIKAQFIDAMVSAIVDSVDADENQVCEFINRQTDEMFGKPRSLAAAVIKADLATQEQFGLVLSAVGKVSRRHQGLQKKNGALPFDVRTAADDEPIVITAPPAPAKPAKARKPQKPVPPAPPPAPAPAPRPVPPVPPVAAAPAAPEEITEASFWHWKAYGRSVRKGEKGKRTPAGTVFHISQTETLAEIKARKEAERDVKRDTWRTERAAPASRPARPVQHRVAAAARASDPKVTADPAGWPRGTGTWRDLSPAPAPAQPVAAPVVAAPEKPLTFRAAVRPLWQWFRGGKA